MKAWRNLERTIPADKEGDLVAVLESGFGIGVDLVQADTSKQPVFKEAVVAKVQTFEEWMDSYMGDHKSAEVLLIDVWEAAHENAARICEEAAEDWRHCGDEYEDAVYLASAIREAANGP